MKHAFNFVSKKSIFHQIQRNIKIKKIKKIFSLIPEKRKKLKRAVLNLFLASKFAQKGSLDFFIYIQTFMITGLAVTFECIYGERDIHSGQKFSQV